ncbi:hypothetical protein [Glutamicibacter sp. NPDC087344]|uniref:hypothetical protein n=1 Tax=Glutamicibacter sp. NPDC087344 TaxID=3363994 RepID=UPI00381CCD2F
MALNDTVKEIGSLFVQDSFCHVGAAVPRPREVTAVEPRLNSPPGGLTRRDQARETDELVGWKVNVWQQSRDEHRYAILDAVRVFVVSTGQMPHYKTFASVHEHRLGVWLHHQHQARTENTLESWRLAALNDAVPGWHRRS